jgi:uncharacterized integral membrane protein
VVRVKKIEPSRARIPGTHLEGWRAIAVGALAVYILLFVVLNRRKLEVNFVFFKVRSHELLALIVILALGFAAGFIVRGRQLGDGSAESRTHALAADTEQTPPEDTDASGRDPASSS